MKTTDDQTRFLRLFLLLSVFAVGSGCAPDAGTYTTPLEEATGDTLTSHEDMLSFLTGLQNGTQAFTMDTIGQSVEGRSLVLLHFNGPDEAQAPGQEKVQVLIFAQQHGDEPSGKEASIALARDLATGEFSQVLRNVDLYLIPQVNPDGSEMRQRRNANDKDLNRDHLTLTTPEVTAVHQVFNELMPHVTLDVHEYGITSSSWVDTGIRKNFGQQIGAISNSNISLELRSYAWDRVIPRMRDGLVERDVRLRRYLVTGGPAERFRYSTTALNDGRNSLGIYNTLSFLIEGQNGLTVEENIRERTRQQLETMKAFLTFFSENAQEARELVARERAKLRGPAAPDSVAVVMDYVPDPSEPTVTVGVMDLETGEPDSLVVENFAPVVQATVWVERPEGYVVPAELTDVLGVLERHGIEAIPAEDARQAMLGSYRILDMEETEKEDKDFLAVDVALSVEPGAVPAEHFLVFCDQIQSDLIVTLLEPHSQWGLAPRPEFDLLTVGARYPIWRMEQPLN